METARILVIEDDPEFGRSAKRLLEQEGMEVETAKNGAEAFERLLYSPFDVVLLDLVLGEESGLSILRELNTSGSTIPIIIMTAHASIETVTEAMRINAFDYIRKPFTREEIREVMRRAIAAGSRPEEDKNREKTGKTMPIIGQSTGMVEVYKAIARVAQTDSTVLITGESGTGKELVARAIHDNSIRATKPFVAVNCGALTDTLLESELFGHVKGAFTGAASSHRGIFESATGGTVFLDEISETSPAFQVKLLRVLQQRTIRPVGSSDERPIDVRVIAATNRPVDNLLTSSFRKDLLYRLSVINIHIPALRERIDDIPLLATNFLRRYNKRQGKSVTIPPDTMEWIKTLIWPGNVRELENAIERAVTMSASGEILSDDLVQFGLITQAGNPGATLSPAAIPAHPPTEPAPPGALKDVIRQHILDVLKYTNGNKLRAAKILGVGRYTLYRMAERFGIDPQELGLSRRVRKKKIEH
ncbi:sigma-54 dependent transcriptional regulator [bacterium]|nr:sigma-54 dependent transcriptional regulator [bacterium]